MKKLACILLALCISGFTFASKGGRRFVASLDNSQVMKSRKESHRSLKEFSSSRRYSSVTRGHSGFHLFKRKSGGASRPESGLGL